MTMQLVNYASIFGPMLEPWPVHLWLVSAFVRVRVDYLGLELG